VIKFKILNKDPNTQARCGILKTSHHEIKTPNFMPVATQGSVKTLSPADLKKIGVEIIVTNTYHLMLRPTSSLIKKMGGLHKFMGWDRAILTDSGGFQVYSLSKLIKTNDHGVEFSSHLDGSRHFLSPEIVVDIQKELGSDIAMVLDFFTSYPSQFMDARIAVERTVNWAKRSLGVKKNLIYSA
jgi:queuine tRNA-ribosyltransferase